MLNNSGLFSMPKKSPGMPAVRDLFRDESSGKIFRVIYAKRRGASDWNEAEVVLCNIFGSHLDIEFISLHQFYTRCMPEYEGEGRLTYVKPADDPYGRLRKIHWDTPANEEKSIENWKRIEGLADAEQKAALKTAGLAHPAAQPRSAVNKSPTRRRTDAAGFGKFKVAKGDTGKGARDQVASSNFSRSDIEEQDEILRVAAENSQKAIDGE